MHSSSHSQMLSHGTISGKIYSICVCCVSVWGFLFKGMYVILPWHISTGTSVFFKRVIQHVSWSVLISWCDPGDVTSLEIWPQKSGGEPRTPSSCKDHRAAGHVKSLAKNLSDCRACHGSRIHPLINTRHDTPQMKLLKKTDVPVKTCTGKGKITSP